MTLKDELREVVQEENRIRTDARRELMALERERDERLRVSVRTHTDLAGAVSRTHNQKLDEIRQKVRDRMRAVERECEAEADAIRKSRKAALAEAEAGLQMSESKIKGEFNARRADLDKAEWAKLTPVLAKKKVLEEKIEKNKPKPEPTPAPNAPPEAGKAPPEALTGLPLPPVAGGGTPEALKA